jgi:hypothetical protein
MVSLYVHEGTTGRKKKPELLGQKISSLKATLPKSYTASSETESGPAQ